MVDAIIYNTNTGFTKQYAYHFAVKTHLPIYSLSESRELKRGSRVVFFTWIKNGKLQELSRMKHFQVEYVCAVGMFPYSEERIQELKNRNEIQNIFYLRGGIRYPKLGMMDRNTLADLRKQYEHRSKKFPLSNEEADMLYILTNGYTSIELEALEPLIEYVLEQAESMVC